MLKLTQLCVTCGGTQVWDQKSETFICQNNRTHTEKVQDIMTKFVKEEVRVQDLSDHQANA